MTWTEARRADLTALLAAGLSFAKAAQRLGVARGSVCWATARFGIGREPANLSRATGRPIGRPALHDERNLTERWADRRRTA